MNLPLNRNAAVAALLGVMSASLGAVIYYEWGWSNKLQRRIVAMKVTPAGISVAELQPDFMIPPDRYGEILNRPLFAQGRHSVAGSSRPSQMKKGQFTLVGVSLAPAKKVVLLRDSASGKIEMVDQGDEIRGMRIDQVEAERVVLAQGQETEELVLKVQKGPAPTMPGPQTVPQPPAAFGSPGIGGWAPRGGMAAPPPPVPGPALSGAPVGNALMPTKYKPVPQSSEPVFPSDAGGLRPAAGGATASARPATPPQKSK